MSTALAHRSQSRSSSSPPTQSLTHSSASSSLKRVDKALRARLDALLAEGEPLPGFSVKFFEDGEGHTGQILFQGRPVVTRIGESPPDVERQLHQAISELGS